MANLKTLALAAFGTVAFAATAHAADPAGNWPPPYQQKPAQVFSEMVSGWYFRGDIGYRVDKLGSASASSVATPIIASRIDNAFAAGIGGGYKYRWFRADVTLDYGTPAKFQGDAPGAASFYSMKIAALTVLANMYVDMGTWSGFTPYIGAGVGTSYLRTSNYMIGSIDNAPTHVNWNLAWAAMAGVSYQVLPNMVIDLGYRYLSLGDAKTGVEPPLTTANTTVKNLSAQEFRVGFRFLLD